MRIGPLNLHLAGIIDLGATHFREFVNSGSRVVVSHTLMRPFGNIRSASLRSEGWSWVLRIVPTIT